MTETVGLDYSTARPNPYEIRAAGYSFVLRYLSPLGTGGAAPGQPNPKDVGAAELALLLDAGLAVGLVYESTANRALGGSGAGHDDGQTAAARAAQVGYPHECVMFWAVDFPAPAGAFPTLQAYGEGFAAGWAGAHHGPYGSGPVIDWLAPHFRWRWQTMAWSNHLLSPNASLLQRVGHYHPIPAGIPAGAVDENVLLDPALPLHRAGVVPGTRPLPPPPAAPAPAPAPRPVPQAAGFDAAAWVTRWRAARGATGEAFVHLQRWANATFPSYCHVSPVAASYGPQTAAFLRELAHRAAADPRLPASLSRPALHTADGLNIGPNLAGALVFYGFAGYLTRAGFRG